MFRAISNLLLRDRKKQEYTGLTRYVEARRTRLINTMFPAAVPAYNAVYNDRLSPTGARASTP